MASHAFRFTARWKEELVVTGPGGSFILELPMGILTARLPTEQAWPTVAPNWAVDLWPVLKTELEQWCRANDAGLEVDPHASVRLFYRPSYPPSGRTIRLAGWLVFASLLAVAAWLLLRLSFI